MTYATSLAVNKRTGGTFRRNQNSAAVSRPKRIFGPVSNSVVLIVLVVLLGLLYLTQVTKTNAHGYELEAAQERQAALMEEHDELEIAAARLRAVDRVAGSEAAQEMVSATPRDTVR